MRSSVVILSTLIAWIVGNTALPQDLGTSDTGLWQAALDLANSGKNEEALQILKSHPSEDPIYYYDLGMLLLKLDRPGPAVAYLEKSVYLNPEDSQAARNLEIARDALSRIMGRDQMDPASNTLEKLADQVGSEELFALLSVAGLVSAAFWVRGYLRVRRAQQRLLQEPSTWIGVIGAAFALASGFAVQSIHDQPAAILLEPRPIRSGPGSTFLELAHLEAGTKLRPTGKTADGPPAAGGDKPHWDQVRYSQDGVGWVEENKLVFLK